MIKIPDELIRMLKERRVIPFIGAGFSSGLNLPDWEALLRRLAEDCDEQVTFDQVAQSCNGDYLQIAEYYLLVKDGNVGPLRQSISNALQNHTPPIKSGAHVELVNLGAPQIYTTNYDDLIELTFKALKLPVEVVALPKDVATSYGAKSQVVKYHGDLRHDSTLVLSESSYYRRLDFESPMDLKFRSDLLGRSVLFMGYSFRDINIRIIWFKLMEMMKDIPSADRPSSYIVRFRHDPVLQRLYDAVGIKTIVLDPENKAVTAEQRNVLFGDFMLTLTRVVAADGRIPGRNTAQYVSSALIDRLVGVIKQAEKSPARRHRGMTLNLEAGWETASQRVVPIQLHDEYQGLLRELVRTDVTPIDAITSMCSNFVRQYGVSPAPAYMILKSLCRTDTRRTILAGEIPWIELWKTKLGLDEVKKFVSLLKTEIGFHKSSEFYDHDIAYVADIVSRIAQGQLTDGTSPDIQKSAQEVLHLAGSMYSSIALYSPKESGPPDVQTICDEINDRIEEIQKNTEDVPF